MVDYIVVIVTGMPRLFAREGRATPLYQENLLQPNMRSDRSMTDSGTRNPRSITKSCLISPKPIRCRGAM